MVGSAIEGIDGTLGIAVAALLATGGAELLACAGVVLWVCVAMGAGVAVRVAVFGEAAGVAALVFGATSIGGVSDGNTKGVANGLGNTVG